MRGCDDEDDDFMKREHARHNTQHSLILLVRPYGQSSDRELDHSKPTSPYELFYLARIYSPYLASFCEQSPSRPGSKAMFVQEGSMFGVSGRRDRNAAEGNQDAAS
jgi:hypothetical protein